GVKIGIIDSGIDYKHPDLGGCFGTGCLVAHGYDFVGDAYTGFNRPQPDSDPMDECNGHGTHVAGIIASTADYFSSISAIGAYRVLGCRGKTNLKVIVSAM
ncbi:peptidase S8/S53 domain-containing protein, partial [Thamnocephalis sphaerospora]